MTLIEARPARPASSLALESRVLVLLAGGTTPSPLERLLRCSLLDLEVSPGTTLLDWWAARDWCNPAQPGLIRTTRGAGSFAPTSHLALPDHAARVTHSSDAAGPRGSAGAIKDVCNDDPQETTIIVAESSTAMLAPLEPIIAAHAASCADVTLVTTTTGRPAGVTLIQRSALDLVKPMGFVDLKEQFLPALTSARGRVGLFEILEEESLPMHDREGILEGLRRIAASCQPQLQTPPPPVIDRRWSPSIIARGAHVDPTALVAGSLVLRGARVGADAVVARSIVAPGAVIAPGDVVIDRIVAPNRPQSRELSIARHRTATR